MTAVQVMEQQRLIDQIVQDASERLAREIDFHVMSQLLCESGWTKVILNPMTHETSREIDQWIDSHCKRQIHALGLVWVFEDPADAVNFTLRWAN